MRSAVAAAIPATARTALAKRVGPRSYRARPIRDSGHAERLWKRQAALRTAIGEHHGQGTGEEEQGSPQAEEGKAEDHRGQSVDQGRPTRAGESEERVVLGGNGDVDFVDGSRRCGGRPAGAGLSPGAPAVRL